MNSEVFVFLAQRYDAAGVPAGEPIALASSSESVNRPRFVPTTPGAFALVHHDDDDTRTP